MVKIETLKPIASKHGANVPSALLPIFSQIGPPLILQSGNFREFSSHASDSMQLALDDEVSHK